MAEKYVERPFYMERMMEWFDDRTMIKVLTGIRRCGKSVIMEQFRQYLINRGISERDIMLIDLEKMRYVIDSERMLYDHISSNIRSDRPVILIDEVQLIKGWERALDSIRLKYDANIYITGSNSETVSESLDIYSFSFKEFLSRYPIDNDNGYTQRFVQYLRYGGMPIIDLKDSQRKNRTILRGVYDSIINNDIRPGMDMDQALLNSMTSFLISNIGNLTTYGSIASRSHMKDQRTVEKYLGKLCGCFIFYKADKYDVIGERHLKSKAKYYLADTGFKDAILLGSEYDEGSLLENAVFIELMRRGYRVSVGSFKDREIDFTAWLDGAPEFYQVAWSINDPMALDREVRSLTKVEGKRVLITIDLDIPEVPDGIEVVRALEFFLERD